MDDVYGSANVNESHSYLVPVAIINGKRDAVRCVSMSEVITQTNLSVFDLQEARRDSYHTGKDGLICLPFLRFHKKKCTRVRRQHSPSRRSIRGYLYADEVCVVDPGHVENEARLLRGPQLKLQDQPERSRVQVRARDYASKTETSAQLCRQHLHWK